MTLQSDDKLTEWLSETWLGAGPVVTVLAGFSGIGKSRIAHEVAENSGRPWAFEKLVQNNLDLAEIALNVAASLEGQGHSTMADNIGENFVPVFMRSLQEPVLVVLDDFHELLDDQGLPPTQFRSLINNLCSARPVLPGRLLLVTNRAPTQESWMDQARVCRVEPPSEDRAIGMLSALLADQGLGEEIPAERRRDVVHWLGRNPRAIQALVACLFNDSLDDLIDLNRDSWDLRDEAVGPELVRHLEERFRDRTLHHLPADSVDLLERLSVYRRTFTKEAIHESGSSVSNAEGARRELISRFLLDRRNNWFSLNPVVRELARARVSLDERKLRGAHGQAAAYYSRHFRARNQDSKIDRAPEFIEARYHLLRSGNGAKFDEIAHDFRRQLLQVYRNMPSLPKSIEAQRELLATLWSALEGEEGGYWALRLLFSRLLLARGEDGDEIVAYRQITMASRESNSQDVWMLRCKLAARLEGPSITRSIIAQAYGSLSPAILAQLVHVAAVKLVDFGHSADALILINDSEEHCTSAREEWLLYHAAAVILFHGGRHDDAVAVLLKGYDKIGPHRGTSSRLIEEGAFMAYSMADIPLLRSIQQKIMDSGGDIEWSTLCEMLKLQCERSFAKAAMLARPYPDYVATLAQRAFGLLCTGDALGAEETLSSISGRYLEGGLGWLRAVTGLALGGIRGKGQAAAWVSDFAQAQGVGPEEITAETLIKSWDTIPGIFGARASFYFPRLPVELTGLDRDLVRLPSMSTALTDVDVSSARFRSTPSHAAVADGSSDAAPAAPRAATGNSINLYTGGAPAILSHSPGRIDMSNYNVGQAGAVGDNPTATGNTFNQVVAGNSAQLLELSAELKRLSAELRRGPIEGQDSQALAEIDEAAAAAMAGDESKVRSHLRRSGQWALAASTSIGTGLAAAWIKSSLGI